MKKIGRVHDFIPTAVTVIETGDQVFQAVLVQEIEYGISKAYQVVETLYSHPVLTFVFNKARELAAERNVKYVARLYDVPGRAEILGEYTEFLSR